MLARTKTINCRFISYPIEDKRTTLPGLGRSPLCSLCISSIKLACSADGREGLSLFGFQRGDRIDAAGPSGRDVCRYYSDTAEDDRYGEKRHRIERIDPDQQTLKPSP